MINEMSALYASGTWKLVSLAQGKSTVGCRRVYVVKVGLDNQARVTLLPMGILKYLGLITMIFSFSWTNSICLSVSIMVSRARWMSGLGV